MDFVILSIFAPVPNSQKIQFAQHNADPNNNHVTKISFIAPKTYTISLGLPILGEEISGDLCLQLKRQGLGMRETSAARNAVVSTLQISHFSQGKLISAV